MFFKWVLNYILIYYTGMKAINIYSFLYLNKLGLGKPKTNSKNSTFFAFYEDFKI